MRHGFQGYLDVLVAWCFDADLDFDITSLQSGPGLFSRVLFRGPLPRLQRMQLYST